MLKSYHQRKLWLGFTELPHLRCRGLIVSEKVKYSVPRFFLMKEFRKIELFYIFLKTKPFCPDSSENFSNDTEPSGDRKEHKVDDCTIIIIDNPEIRKEEEMKQLQKKTER